MTCNGAFRQRWQWKLLAVSVAIALTLTGAANATISILEWDLACVVLPNQGYPRGVLFQQVVTPFIDSHQITWQGATDSAAYDISFDAQQLGFRADVSVTAPGVNPRGQFTSGCTANVQFTTTTDVLFSIDAAMQYNLPPGDREVVFDARSYAHNGPGYFADGFAAAPVFGDPASGQYAMHADNIRMLGGASYTMSYEFELVSFSGSPTLLSRMDGFVEFHLTPIPEPAAALLLLAALPCLRRLGKRR